MYVCICGHIYAYYIICMHYVYVCEASCMCTVVQIDVHCMLLHCCCNRKQNDHDFLFVHTTCITTCMIIKRS